MENKPMYSLTYCFEGNVNNCTYPYAVTLAVSFDRDKLVEKMNECVEEDCAFDFEDEWNDSINFEVYNRVGTEEVILRHRKSTDLYAKYKIDFVEVL